MGKNTKPCSKEFLKYQKEILSSPYYNTIPHKVKRDGSVVWLAPKNTEIGQARIEWLKNIVHELNLNIDTSGTSWYYKVLYQIHPTKVKPCKICGRILSIDYIYLSKNFIKKINSSFKINFELTPLTSIYDLCDLLINNNYTQEQIKEFIDKQFKINSTNTLDESISKAIEQSRNGLSKKLGPGAMSNFPDRLCGYHDQNRCCREKEDRGRSADNLRTYNKDRRAYELWVDGNIESANKFMRSEFFKDCSADHIGPISLGFKHESIFLEPMLLKDNSAKRDRLSKLDIVKLISLENYYGISAMSWFSKNLWNYIKKNYENLNDNLIRSVLKQNMHDYMEILFKLKTFKPEILTYFLNIKTQDLYFKYEHNESGEIISKKQKKDSLNLQKEIERLKRIRLDSLDEYHNKSLLNRNLKFNLSYDEENVLKSIIYNNTITLDDALNKLEYLMQLKQKHLIYILKNN